MTQPRDGNPISRILAVLLGGAILLALSCISSAPDQSHEGTVEPDARFAQISDLEWPETAEVVVASDTHARQGEGEFYIVFDVDVEVLEDWLSNPPPWGTGEWLNGPVPPEIGSHPSFGTDGVSIGQFDDGPYEYRGDEQLVTLLSSDEIWYVARERCCGEGSLYFHNGDLLVLDLDARRVWLSSWDF